MNDEYSAAMADPLVQAIWWGEPNPSRELTGYVHWYAMADRCEELGLHVQAECWRQEGRNRRPR